jgi:hypothetical protein
VCLALFHGVNGLCGIIRDYNPRPNLRLPIELIIWTITALFAARALANVIDPVPLADVKALYAERGFPAGETRGNPPGPAKQYDFRTEHRELLLLEYYLAHHTHRTDAIDTAAVFGHAPGVAVTPDAVSAAGAALDRWIAAQIALDVPPTAQRDRSMIFSNSHEFAVWAKEVRRANARERMLDPNAEHAARLRDQRLLERLPLMPAYHAAQLH